MSKKLLIVLLIITCFNVTKGQEINTSGWSKEDQKIFETANKLFNKKYYESAYEKYAALQTNHEKDLFLKFVRGVCGVYITNKHKEAERLLSDVKKNDKKAEGVDYYLALLYHKSYLFDKALGLASAQLKNPKLSKEDRADLEQLVTYCKNGKQEIQYPFETMIEPVSKVVNSADEEYAPVISPDEESIIYTYRGKESMGGLVDENNMPNPKGDYNEDIFISKKINGVWQKPTGITELNTVGNDAAIAISPDGKFLFIFRADAGNGDIYVSKKENGKYLPAEKLAGEINSPSWEGSMSISTDQKKLFFSSDRPGGFGGKDLYVAIKKADGTWGNIKNLGPKINTKYDEDSPFISADGHEFIFSSEGHNSMGDFDLFVSDLNTSDSSWAEPKNLGYPVNTTDDDLFYVLSQDGKRGYFSSAREGGSGNQDIYMVEPALAFKKNYITSIQGKVTEDLVPFETEISVGVAGEAKSYGSYRSSGTTGNYAISLPTGKNYKLSFNHPTLGNKIFTINTEQVEDYAEKVIDVNFNTKDTTKFIASNIVVTKNDSAKTKPKLRTDGKNVFASYTSNSDTISKTSEKNAVAMKSAETKSTEKNTVVTASSETKTSEKNSALKAVETKTILPKTTENNSSPKSNKGDVSSTGGLKCKRIRTNHDADFNYRKCNDVWYTISKPNAYSKYAKGFFKEWTSLSDNPLANEKLDKRFPKG